MTAQCEMYMYNVFKILLQLTLIFLRLGLKVELFPYFPHGDIARHNWQKEFKGKKKLVYIIKECFTINLI